MTAPTDHMTIAEIIHDYAQRYDLYLDRRAREDLAAILERRMVAERVKVMTSVAVLAEQWEADDRESLDTFGQHQYATTWQLAGMLRDVLADHIRTTETEGES